MAPSGDHSMATTASSTRRGVHELTPDLLLRFFSTERDWRVPRYRASSGDGGRRRGQGQGEGQGEGEDRLAGCGTAEHGTSSRGAGRRNNPASGAATASSGAARPAAVSSPRPPA